MLKTGWVRIWDLLRFFLFWRVRQERWPSCQNPFPTRHGLDLRTVFVPFWQTLFQIPPFSFYYLHFPILLVSFSPPPPPPIFKYHHHLMSLTHRHRRHIVSLSGHHTPMHLPPSSPSPLNYAACFLKNQQALYDASK